MCFTQKFITSPSMSSRHSANIRNVTTILIKDVHFPLYTYRCFVSHLNSISWVKRWTKSRLEIQHTRFNLHHVSKLQTFLGISRLASYQIRKIVGCACARNAGNVFPATDLKKTLVIDPGIHHSTCVTHVLWCMSGSLTRGGGKNVPGITSARN